MAAESSTVDANVERPWFRIVRYSLGTALCLLTVRLMLNGFPWYGCVIIFCAAVVILLGGQRRIFQAGVQRSGQEITCRYVPLYESYTYFGAVWMPIFGGATAAAGVAEHDLRFLIGGIFLCLVAILLIVFTLLMGRRCVLYITPSILRVRSSVIGADARVLTEVQRESVEAITPRRVPGTFGFQVEILFSDADAAGGTTQTVRLGPQAPQVSVAQINLLNGLRLWQGGSGDPTERLDQIERILRGHDGA